MNSKRFFSLSSLILILCWIIETEGYERQDFSMMENNYYHAGFLVVKPEDSTWADWGKPHYMIIQDNDGKIFPFIPPFVSEDQSNSSSVIKSAAQKWFSHLGAGPVPEIKEKDTLLVDEVKKQEQLENEQWDNSGRVISIESADVEEVESDADARKNRIRRIVPKKTKSQ